MTGNVPSYGESPEVGAEDAPSTGGGAVEVIPLLYDLILWMAPKLAHYPKIHRFTLEERIMECSASRTPPAAGIGGLKAPRWAEE